MNQSRKAVIFGLIALFSSLSAATAKADSLLNLQLAGSPDIVATLLNVDYNATTDAFSVSGGFGFELDDDDTPPNETIVGGNLSINAQIDDTGALQPGGTVTVSGTVPTLGFGSGTLLTGTLDSFGFAPSGSGSSILEFLFTVTGGDAAPLYAPAPRGVGIVLDNTGFTGSFASNFGVAFMGTADIAPAVPEPSTLTLALFGSLGLIGVHRKRRQGQMLKS